MPCRVSTRARSRHAAGVGVAVAALLAASGFGPPAHAAGTVYYVAPGGADTNKGTSSAAPFRTIQHALDLARPGTTIALAAGTYGESLVTKVAGTAAAPIAIRGPETGKDVAGRYRAVLSSRSKAVSINHSYYTLDGFTIDGQPNIARSEYPTTLAEVRAFKDSVQGRTVNSKLVYVGAADTASDVTGVTISNMYLNGSGGECVRFRNRATNGLVVGSVIRWCGMYAGSGDDVTEYRYHNAEGVYVGTSPKSTAQPMAANDTSGGIVVRDSTVHTFGSECLEVKENAHDNRLERSDCGFNDEPLAFKGSNVELRGHHNVVIDSRVTGSRSWNVKMASDAPFYDLGGNSVQRSTFGAAAAPALRADQSTVGSTFCGNTFDATPVSEGSSDLGDPAAPCPDTVPPTAPTSLAAKATSPTSAALSWGAAGDDVGVVGYGVRRNGVEIATTPDLTFTDTTLSPGTSYTYAVVARDAAGNTSPTSGAVSVTTPVNPVTVEAESGTVTSPMAVRADSGAQGGRYVSQTTGTTVGKDTITVTVPVAGRYAPSLRVISPTTSSDSFTASVDGGAATVWNLGTHASWTWVTLPTLTLSAGQHRIVVSKRENNARLDALRLSQVV
jgi:chitodextrinase